MLLATIAIVGPAATRASVLLLGRGIRDPHVFVMLALVLAAVISLADPCRPHWLACGAFVLIASQVTRRVVGGSCA